MAALTSSMRLGKVSLKKVGSQNMRLCEKKVDAVCPSSSTLGGRAHKHTHTHTLESRVYYPKGKGAWQGVQCRKIRLMLPLSATVKQV